MLIDFTFTNITIIAKTTFIIGQVVCAVLITKRLQVLAFVLLPKWFYRQSAATLLIP